MSTFLNNKVGVHQLSCKEIMTDPILFLAFGFGSGLARKAPGTFGTLAAIPLYLLLVQMGVFVYSMMTILIVISGIGICGIAAKKIGEHDFGGIVWDEIAGYLITLWWIPFSWHNVVLAFVLFRVFDILKPWPISWFDRKIKGGGGIMLDDIIAGVIANFILVLLIRN